MLYKLDPDQVRHFVGPDLDPNCLQRLLADITSRQRVEYNKSQESFPLQTSINYHNLFHFVFSLSLN